MNRLEFVAQESAGGFKVGSTAVDDHDFRIGQ
jgi:hypothetical protein